MIVEESAVLMEGYALATGESIGFRVGCKRFYFVLTDVLLYYETKESFDARATPVGIIELEIFSLCKNESRGKFQLAIHAYPKSIEFNLDSSETLRNWIDAFNVLSSRSVVPNFTI